MRQPIPAAPALPVSSPDLPMALLAPLGRDVVWRLGRAARVAAGSRAMVRVVCSTHDSAAHEDALAIIDEELSRLLAARELFVTWVERTAEQEGRGNLTPAQFLRAWSESTGRVIQLLKARRELGGSGETDARLEAVYAELEAELLRASEPHLHEEETA